MDTAAASLGSGTVVRQDGEDFAIDWGQKWARCPRGRLSIGWKEYTDADRSPYVSIRFSASDCRDCPVRPQCTRASKQGRHLKVPTEAQHAALREVRSFIDSEAGRQLYARRAGIEGTLSQGVRSFGLRRARYRGEAKAHLQHVATMCGAELQPGLGLAGRRAVRGDAGLAVCAAGGLSGIRQLYPAHLGKVPIRARASLRSLPGRPGRFDVDLEPGTLEHKRPALGGRRAQNPLQDHGDVARAMLGDVLEHLSIVLAVELRECGQGSALEDQLDDGLAGRPLHWHQVPGDGVGRERHRDLETGDPDCRMLHHGTILLIASEGDSVIPGLRVSGQGVIDQVHHVRLLMLGEAHEPIFCRLRCPGCCQWALQNQPLMGASKPATSFRGSRSHSHSTHLRFLFKASGTDSAFFSRPRRGPHVGTTSRQTIAPPGANRTPIASSLPLVRALRAGGRFGWF